MPQQFLDCAPTVPQVTLCPKCAREFSILCPNSASTVPQLCLARLPSCRYGFEKFAFMCNIWFRTFSTISYITYGRRFELTSTMSYSKKIEKLWTNFIWTVFNWTVFIWMTLKNKMNVGGSSVHVRTFQIRAYKKYSCFKIFITLCTDKTFFVFPVGML